MNTFDCVVVGSGINSLVCSALLAMKGRSVCLLERNDRLGGCIRTDELTVPGFRHDALSGFHPLFITSPGYAQLKDALHANGLEYVNTERPTGVLMPDGRHFILRTSREENVKNMNMLRQGDGDRYAASMRELEHTAHLTFGLLGNQLWSRDVFWLLAKEVWRNGLHSLMAYFGRSMDTARDWLESSFQSDEVKACLAPWILHTGLGPEGMLSGHMNRLIAFTLEQAGMPIVRGGSDRLVEAFRNLIEARGGITVVNADVDHIITEGGTAKGVRAVDRTAYWARRAVICNVTPTQLYQRLLDAADVPAEVAAEARGYRYGRGDMQVHLALDEPPQWPHPELRNVAMLHLTPGLDGVSKAVNEADRGLLPETATIVVAQPTALDPSRAPAGKWILWIQLQELPRVIKGDAAGEITVPSDGRWNEEVRERYADRIIDRLVQHIPNLKQKILGRSVLSPADLERLNMNLVGGDPYSGSCALNQFMLWRPLRATRNHETPLRNLFHIGASTHPGPGLGGVSGFLVAQKL